MVIVSARQAALSISESVDLLEFYTHTHTQSFDFTQNGAKKSSEMQFCRLKCLVNENG